MHIIKHHHYDLRLKMNFSRDIFKHNLTELLMQA